MTIRKVPLALLAAPILIVLVQINWVKYLTFTANSSTSRRVQALDLVVAGTLVRLKIVILHLGIPSLARFGHSSIRSTHIPL